MKERKKFEVIRKVSEILNKFKQRRDILVTVVDLILPRKGGTMRIYLSIYPKIYEKETIKYFNEISRGIIKEIRENIYLRYLPSKVIFYSSDEFEIADKVLKLIKEIEDELKKSES